MPLIFELDKLSYWSPTNPNPTQPTCCSLQSINNQDNLIFGDSTIKNENLFLKKRLRYKISEHRNQQYFEYINNPIIKQVDAHNEVVLRHFSAANVVMSTITAQDQIVDATRNVENMDLDKLIPTDINKTGGLPKQLTLFQTAKVMLRYNVDTSKGLVNGAIGHVTQIIWPLFRRAQLYAHDIPAVMVDFGVVGVHRIEPISIQFPAKYSAGMAERRMLPLILCWSSTVHKLQGCTIDHAVINLGPKIFAPGQAYVALSRVRTFDGIRLEELDCGKITGPNVCNKKALEEMERLRTLPNYID